MANDKAIEISNEQRKALCDHVLCSLAQDDVRRWAKCWDAAALSPHNPVTGTRYRGVNRAWLSFAAMLEGYGDSRWLTFNEVRKHEGWHLRKGSHGHKVEKWTLRTIALTDDEGEPLVDEDGEQRTRSYLFLQSMHTVLNASCVEGIEPMSFPVQDDAELFEVADRFIALVRKHGAYLEDAEDGAYYTPLSNTIHLPMRATFATARDFCATLFHEFAHSTKAAERMGRVRRDMGDASYAFEELVAEMTSLFVQADMGFDSFGNTTENSIAYLQGWARKAHSDEGTVKLVMQAITEAQRVADWIVALYHAEYGTEQMELAA